VKKGFLLDGITLHACGVSPRHIEFPTSIEAHFAHAGLALRNRAAMAAGKTTDAVVAETFDEGGIGFADALIQNLTQGGHGEPLGAILALAERGGAFGFRYSGKG